MSRISLAADIVMRRFLNSQYISGTMIAVIILAGNTFYFYTK
jgi:hypothetical protein